MWLSIAIVLLVIATGYVAYQLLWQDDDCDSDIPCDTQAPEIYVDEAVSDMYQYDNKTGGIVFVPYSQGQRVLAAFVTLGQSVNSETMQEVDMHGVDLASFEVLDSEYARDVAQIYFRGLAVEEADPDSFVILDYGYGRDATALWYRGVNIFEINNKETEVVVHDPLLVTIGEQSYMLMDGDLLALDEEPQTERVPMCPDDEYGVWYTMNNALWYGNIRFDIAVDDLVGYSCRGSRVNDTNVSHLWAYRGNTIWHAVSNGTSESVVTLDTTIVGIWEIAGTPPVAVTQLENGVVTATEIENTSDLDIVLDDATPQSMVMRQQVLGTFETLTTSPVTSPVEITIGNQKWQYQGVGEEIFVPTEN